MRTLLRNLAAVGLLSLALATPAFAQYYPSRDRDSRSRDWERGATAQRVAYDNGYREGFERGERDGRSGREFDIDRDNAFRQGDRGYHRGYGNRDAYRAAFRDGYAAGYTEAYDRYCETSGRRGGIGRDRFPDRGRRVPGSSRRLPGRDDRYGYNEVAFENGYNDGFEKGLEDARDRDPYDPVRHGRYRSGDRGYNSRYGSRDAYKNTYRDGFREGYDRGYREAQRYGRDDRRSRTSRRGFPWPF